MATKKEAVMRQVRQWVIMVAVLAAGASAVHADNGWGLLVSYWDPSDGEGAFAPGLKLSIEMVPSVQMGVRVSYFDDLGKDQHGANVKLKAVPVEADLVLNMPVSEAGRLYGGIGIGYYMLDADIERADGTEPDADPGDKLGYYFLVGGRIRVQENAALFAELKYTLVDADDIGVNADGGLEDGKLDGPGANAGLLIVW
jgi:opacity protein-like surface antigen